ncbi:sensor histidine kinase [Luteimonas sp. MC1572]|uniref:sensor histidine kinase n=1 Tax=Luteimonas sp. MC1572 TaxID=2799325 RepID=UPI0018F072AF|nr:sensor histidine kinase [Luteimonas sp. MC1572]MBJ6981589.1 sensor histidine kinase [Luteimonas sp. MC1572]QQO02887.1 sensor histidine kinase [Luteimonas sp. MC1572]
MEHAGAHRAKLSGWRAWVQPAPDSALAAVQRQGRSAWTEWVHLMWSAWVFTTPLFTPDGYSTRWALLTLLTYPLFVLLYACVLLRPERNAWRYALAMIALGMLLLPWYPSGMSYFVFGCVMLRSQRARSLVRYVLLLAVLNAAFVGFALWLGYPWQAVVWLPLVALIVGTIVHVEHASHAADAALRLSHDEVRRLAALAERERIGRDLHDLLGHTLSLVALKSDLAARLVERDPAAARAEIDAVSRVARDALAQVRSAVSGIRAAGIAAELASAKLLLECDGVGLRHDWDERGLAGGALPARVETTLALVLREAVTNIQRHARAQSAEITMRAAGEGITLRIRDDGRGGAIVPGNGVGGMRERIESLGGRMDIGPAPGGGTVVEAWLPLSAHAAGDHDHDHENPDGPADAGLRRATDGGA